MLGRLPHPLDVQGLGDRRRRGWRCGDLAAGWRGGRRGGPLFTGAPAAWNQDERKCRTRKKTTPREPHDDAPNRVEERRARGEPDAQVDVEQCTHGVAEVRPLPAAGRGPCRRGSRRFCSSWCPGTRVPRGFRACASRRDFCMATSTREADPWSRPRGALRAAGFEKADRSPARPGDAGWQGVSDAARGGLAWLQRAWSSSLQGLGRSRPARRASMAGAAGTAR